jgi:hypothetical protein
MQAKVALANCLMGVVLSQKGLLPGQAGDKEEGEGSAEWAMSLSRWWEQISVLGDQWL